MPGPSGYTAAFTHPDPLDPNDAQRQRTQARPVSYPYDQPVSYGRAVGTDSGGAAYQSGARSAPPVPRNLKASDWEPKDPWDLANEMAEGMTDPYCPGPQADDAARLGYGSHGRMGEDDEVDMDDLRKTFRSCIPASELGPVVLDLLALLASQGEEDDDSDADGDDGILSRGGRGKHVFAPGAEWDPETL